MSLPVALTIAGADPSGGAGLQADLKTFHQRGVYGMAVTTLVTIQNTQGVSGVITLKAEEVTRQLEAVLSDIPPHAIKTGALGDETIITALASRLAAYNVPVVVDPVMLSKHQTALMSEAAYETFRRVFLPLATLVTPNLFEAAQLTSHKVKDIASMGQAARSLVGMGAKAALVKGGHLDTEAADVLFYNNRIEIFRAPHLEMRHTHGTGCTFSAAITAELAKGKDLISAIQIAKQFITKAIEHAPRLGHGIGPVNHFIDV